MRARNIWTVAMAVGLGVGMAGCNKEEASSGNSGTSAGTTSSGTGGGTSATAPSVEGMKETVTGAVAGAAAEAKKVSAETVEKVKTTAAEAQAKGAEAMAAASAEAQKYLDQAMGYVKERKWDLADGALKQLEALKPKLTAEWQAKVEQARKTFNTTKAAVGEVKVPGFN